MIILTCELVYSEEGIMKEMSITLITRFNRLVIYILFVLLIGILYHGLIQTMTQTNIMISRWFVYSMIVAFSLVLIKDFFDDYSLYIRKKEFELNHTNQLVDDSSHQDTFRNTSHDIINTLFYDNFISMVIWDEEGKVVKCNDALYGPQ